MSELESNTRKHKKVRDDNKSKESKEEGEKEQHPTTETTQNIDATVVMEDVIEKLKLLN